jgi:pSer/pThr/pTyr-binding forkhead associated (FHA) protein/NADPH-dependent 2,4-dienoyl-CoA reductase/sulfur reductase-like enzyme
MGHHFLIVGDGATGTAAAEGIRRADSTAVIQIVSDDPNPAYFRAALTNYLIGGLTERQLYAVPPDFYQRYKIKRVRGRVDGVNAGAKTITLQDGETLPWDSLIIASGSRPRPPSFLGSKLTGVMTLRTLQDANYISQHVQEGYVKQAIVVGGGPLALEWVQAFREKHVEKVTLLLRQRESLMRGKLDRTARDLLLGRLKLKGVEVVIDEIVEAVGDGTHITGVILKSGAKKPCDFVGFAAGIQPNCEFLQSSTIELNKRGVVVNELLETNVDGVYAGGDVASMQGGASLGLWEPARKQGEVIARNATGRPKPHTAGAHYFATRLFDLDFAQVGVSTPEPGDVECPGPEPAEGRIGYTKLIVRDGRLAGALMIGERSERVRARGRDFQQLVDSGLNIENMFQQLHNPHFDLRSWLSRQEGAKVISASDMESWTDRFVSTPSSGGGDTVSLPAIEGILTNPKDGWRLKFSDQASVGRGPGNDLTLADPGVSGRHALIRWDGRRFVLEDLGSRNHSYINGFEATQATPLRPSDQLTFGESTIEFEFARERPAPPIKVNHLETCAMSIEQLQAALREGNEVHGLSLVHGDSRHELTLEWQILGRSEEAQITINDPAVSLKHAELVWVGEDLFARDLGSRNGTLVNGDPVSAPTPLTSGDVLRVGATDFKVVGQSSPAIRSPLMEPAPVPASAPKTPPPSTPTRHPIQMTSTHPPLTIALTGSASLRIGRNPESEVTIEHSSVSWAHAHLIPRDDGWTIMDAGSTNGTTVNDQPVDKHPVPISEGARVAIGEVQFDVRAVHTPVPTARIRVVEGLSKGLVKEVKYRLRVGRNEATCGLILTDDSVSGNHLEIAWRDGHFSVEDLGSTNGTFLGDLALDDQPQVLGNGATIRIANDVFLVMEVDE